MAYENYKQKQARADFYKREAQKERNKNKPQTKLNTFQKVNINLHDVITKQNYIIDKKEAPDFMDNYEKPYHLIIISPSKLEEINEVMDNAVL